MKSTHVLKRLLFSGLLLAATGSALAADVGVSISVGQPGFYGRIDIGDYPYPQPRLIYSNPIIVHRHADVYYEPLYLRVPPGHAKNWRRYCGRYNACGQPAYFVQDNWYRNEYAPVYRERHGYGHYGRDNDRYDRDNDRYGRGDDRRGRDNDRRGRDDDRNDRGGNRGHGHDNGRGGNDRH